MGWISGSVIETFPLLQCSRSISIDMQVKVLFHSYFRELAGCAETTEMIAQNASLGKLVGQLQTRFPKLKGMERSTLVAVGLEYQRPEYVLQEGDEVSLFPPVQG